MLEVTKAEEDATRWKQACELEVEAGRTAIEERDREVNDLFYTILIFILYFF